MRLELDGFAAAWSHCGDVADYVARFAASDRYDPEGLTTRIASYLNEVLELLFAHHPGGASLDLVVTREDNALHVACTMPTNEALTATMERVFQGLSRDDLRSELRSALRGYLDQAPPEAAFIEMSGVHGITPRLTRDGDAVTVSLTIPAE
ncbi:MAG: hypothetical protein R3B09_08185 [Nannocystaceae bacterium]